jgi:hypothetical protein
MVMDSVPDEIGQYIQASSRSARRRIGLVVSVFPTYSLRATSIYHRFREFHDHMDRLVSPVPVNRFAKYAVERTAPGVMTGVIFGRFNPQHGGMLVKRREAAVFLRALQQEFATAVEAAYALQDGVYGESVVRAMRESVQTQIVRFIHTVRNSDRSWLTQAVRPQPMMSLRDVEPGVPFFLDDELAPGAEWWLRGKRP